MLGDTKGDITSVKPKCLDIFMYKRLEEEILLLEQEMVRFLCYYSDKIIPDLASCLDSLGKEDVPTVDMDENMLFFTVLELLCQ
ncbi:Hypothetical predicted protein [Paramuricea clavata]|uniref:Uncharacterized protein n=1 Tax=Paramuricea clavata TaxID=317549 RepID=A0A6S7JKP4_PARCT|nr:Hypothetical predicted protein [Paramuricea clavata]